MEKILKEDKLEELLVANWAAVLDTSRLMAFCLKNVRDTALTVIPETRKIQTSITLSRFQTTPQGFILWVEFSVPNEEKIAVGTTELILSFDGQLTHVQTLGNLYSPSNNV